MRKTAILNIIQGTSIEKVTIEINLQMSNQVHMLKIILTVIIEIKE
jgi:hypothetical protein